MDRLFARRRNVTIGVDYPRSAMVAASNVLKAQDKTVDCNAGSERPRAQSRRFRVEDSNVEDLV